MVGKKKIISKCLFYVVISLILILFLIPIFWIFSTSFKSPADWMHDPPVWIPTSSTLENFAIVLKNDLGGIINSLIVVLSSSVIALSLGTIASYSISRFKTGGKNLPVTILSAYFLPPIVFAIPFLMMYKTWGLIDTRIGLIIIYTAFNMALVVWMMKGFFDEIPRDIDEMSLIDGCTYWGSFFRIDLRLVVPGLVSCFLLIVLLSWGEYMFALTLTGSKATTIPLRLSLYWNESTRISWGPQAALSVIGTVPILTITFFIQKHIVRGLTFGAIK
jgi:multiple sugar transport system permease protein